MAGINSRLDKLTVEFLDSGDVVTNTAASCIQKRVRGILARAKYHKAKDALAKWRWKNALNFRSAAITFFQTKYSKDAMADALYNMHKGRKLKAQALLGWAELCSAAASVTNLAKALKRENSKRQMKRLMGRIMGEWNKVSHGWYSRKNVVARYQQRREEAKKALIGLGLYHATQEQISDRVETEAIWRVRRLGGKVRRKYAFNEWKSEIHDMAKIRNKMGVAALHEVCAHPVLQGLSDVEGTNVWKCLPKKGS